jgi:hypothetical protein
MQKNEDVIKNLQNLLGIHIDTKLLIEMAKLVEEGYDPQALIQILKNASRVAENQ